MESVRWECCDRRRCRFARDIWLAHREPPVTEYRVFAGQSMKSDVVGRLTKNSLRRCDVETPVDESNL